MSSKKQKLLLGQSMGKAAHRLRKSIMFDLACKLNLLNCYRCKQPITSTEELSVDHKEAWMRAVDPVAAFFDVKNIAFSHPLCNYHARIPYRKYPTKEAAKIAKKMQHNSAHYKAKKAEWKKRWRNERRRLGLKVTM